MARTNVAFMTGTITTPRQSAALQTRTRVLGVHRCDVQIRASDVRNVNTILITAIVYLWCDEVSGGIGGRSEDWGGREGGEGGRGHYRVWVIAIMHRALH